ncbi:MAG: AAA family ATPase [Phycisphaerae bacterium]|nr:AAA family ATPase [Phycisphaerae bacterium]
MPDKSQTRVILIGDEPETRKAVASALEAHGKLALAEKCPSLAGLGEHLEKVPIAAVLVDLGPSPAEVLAELDPIIARSPNTRFVTLADVSTDELIFKAMEIGVRYFLLKDNIASKLPPILERLVVSNGSPVSESRGSVITVLSASGGCGATTLVVNLANELHLVTSRPVLVMDMDCSYGAVSTYLGLEGEYGLADVLTYNGRIDPELIRSSASEYSGGLHVLMSPFSISPAVPRPLKYENLGDTLDACSRAYGYTVLDAPRVSLDVATELAKTSEVVLIVFQLNVKDIRLAKMMFRTLTERGTTSNRILPLVSRYRKRNPMLSLEEGRASLGCKSLDWVSNDFRSAIRGLNYGQPLSEIAPRSSLRKDVHRLALKVTRNGVYSSRNQVSNGF